MSVKYEPAVAAPVAGRLTSALGQASALGVGADGVPVVAAVLSGELEGAGLEGAGVIRGAGVDVQPLKTPPTTKAATAVRFRGRDMISP
ncbi:MAG: hypothetical protein M3Y49_06780 [Actinomycetota bacterium]|nr:hypothetical protein [Actinomycetota bacterium]